MPLVIRSMFVDGAMPKVGAARGCLGVRPGVDIKPDTDGKVHPQSGKGMSVSPSIEDLPPLLIPLRLAARYPG